jgi:hypothetical protein
MDNIDFIVHISSQDDVIDIDESTIDTIHWPPIMNTIIPERFECLERTTDKLTDEQNRLLEQIREFIDETRLAALCCELVRRYEEEENKNDMNTIRSIIIDLLFVLEFVGYCLLASINASYCCKTFARIHRSVRCMYHLIFDIHATNINSSNLVFVFCRLVIEYARLAA